MAERDRVRARVARDGVLLVTRRLVVEADDEGQILDCVAVGVDVEDVADVRAELAAKALIAGLVVIARTVREALAPWKA